jgi:hypothetical protein
MTRRLTTTMLKGSPEYAVTDGVTVLARAHCVNVPANLFTVVVGGCWAGVLPEAEAVAALTRIAS